MKFPYFHLQIKERDNLSNTTHFRGNYLSGFPVFGEKNGITFKAECGQITQGNIIRCPWTTHQIQAHPSIQGHGDLSQP